MDRMILNILIFWPLLAGLMILLFPASSPRAIRWGALAATFIDLALSVGIWLGHDANGPALQWETRLAWIPGLGASYHVALDGLSLPLVVMTTLLMALAMLYALPQKAGAKTHVFLFLLMETGLIGLFSAQDLLLFYLFFEVGLVPMYFIIGIFGHGRRRYAAVKFFLYTRAGSLFMLLAFLGINLNMTPHSFSLPEIIAAQPLGDRPLAGGLALLGLLIGFGVKIPMVPLHNWLPDAHVEAPTEGSVLLAGIQLKMGGYGLLRIALPVLPEAAHQFGWGLLAIAIVSMLYGALASLAQNDFKRLVAYTSVNHMGYVTLGAGVWALSVDPGVRQMVLNGAMLQMVSHGLLTGGMFFMAGILQSHSGTLAIDRIGGLFSRLPLYSVLLALLAFGSLGLPGFSGFPAEFQVIGGTVVISLTAAVLAVLALVITTGIYLKVLLSLGMGQAPRGMPLMKDLNGRELTAVVPLACISFIIGIMPNVLLGMIGNTTRLLALVGG